MSSENSENKSLCIDCGADISRNGKDAGQRYVCSICGADYRDTKKTTISNLTKKLNVWEIEIQEIDKKVSELQGKREILKDNIYSVNSAIRSFNRMIKILDVKNIKNKDKEDVKYDRNTIVVDVREQIKETLKLK